MELKLMKQLNELAQEILETLSPEEVKAAKSSSSNEKSKVYRLGYLRRKHPKRKA